MTSPKMTNSPLDSEEFLVGLNQAADRVARFFTGSSREMAERGYVEFIRAVPLLHSNRVLILIERPNDILMGVIPATAPICQILKS